MRHAPEHSYLVDSSKNSNVELHNSYRKLDVRMNDNHPSSPPFFQFSLTPTERQGLQLSYNRVTTCVGDGSYLFGSLDSAVGSMQQVNIAATPRCDNTPATANILNKRAQLMGDAAYMRRRADTRTDTQKKMQRNSIRKNSQRHKFSYQHDVRVIV